jgi:hypothetical protein
LAQTLNPSAGTFKALSRQRDNVYSRRLYDGSRKFVYYFDNLGLIFLYLPLPVVKERRNGPAKARVDALSSRYPVMQVP